MERGATRGGIREGNRKIRGEETHKRRRADLELGHRERSERKTSIHTAKKNSPSEVEARSARGKTARCRLQGETARAQTGPGQRLGGRPRQPFLQGAEPVLSWEQYSTPHWPPLPKGSNNLERQATGGGASGGDKTQLDALLAGLTAWREAKWARGKGRAHQ